MKWKNICFILIFQIRNMTRVIICNDKSWKTLRLTLFTPSYLRQIKFRASPPPNLNRYSISLISLCFPFSKHITIKLEHPLRDRCLVVTVLIAHKPIIGFLNNESEQNRNFTWAETFQTTSQFNASDIKKNMRVVVILISFCVTKLSGWVAFLTPWQEKT